MKICYVPYQMEIETGYANAQQDSTEVISQIACGRLDSILGNLSTVQDKCKVTLSTEPELKPENSRCFPKATFLKIKNKINLTHKLKN